MSFRSETKYINDATFVVIDVETTGQSAYTGRMTEIGMVKVIDGQIVDEYSTLINPGQFIPAFITQLTGITNEMVFSAPKFSDIQSKVRNFLGDGIFTAHNVNFDYEFVNQSFLRDTGKELTNERLCTCKLARRLVPILKSKSLESLIHHFNIKVESRHRALDDARVAAFLLNHFTDIVENKYELETLDDLLGFQNKQVFHVKKPPKNFVKIWEFLETLPNRPGVYFMYDKDEALIYIGKAKILKDRVSSYFHYNSGHSDKVFEMVRQIRSIKFEETDSELSALLLEEKLIKKHKPLYNTAQKRYRRYPFLKITMGEIFPYLDWDYNIEDDGSEYYGPFINRDHIESFLEMLNKLFKLRECRELKRNNRMRCIYPELNRCMAPCVNNDVQKYKDEIQNIRTFLSGNYEDLFKQFENIMLERANELRFEEAAEMRDKIKMVKYFVDRHKFFPSSINNANFVVIIPLERTSFELFLIKNGKVLTTTKYDKFDEKKIISLLNEYCFEESLFREKKIIPETAKLKILLGWVYKNYKEVKIINYQDKNLKETIEEIKNSMG